MFFWSHLLVGVPLFGDLAFAPLVRAATGVVFGGFMARGILTGTGQAGEGDEWDLRTARRFSKMAKLVINTHIIIIQLMV